MVIRWGDPVLPGAPAFDLNRQTAAAQSSSSATTTTSSACCRSAGTADRALLVVNHEYTNEELMFPGFTGLDALTVEQLGSRWPRTACPWWSSSGSAAPASGGRQTTPRLPYNRRITALATPFDVHRPGRRLGAGCGPRPTRRARTVIGTLNNCSGGVTPWGTVLSGEENFNQYFVGGDGAPAAAQAEAGPVRHHHHRPLPERLAQMGPRPGAVRPGQAPERGAPVRLDRRGRPVRPAVAPAQAHRAGPVQARGRERHRGQERQGRRVHGRRRAVRLPLQVRLGQEVPQGRLARRPAGTT